MKKYVIIAVLVLAAFFASYTFASARSAKLESGGPELATYQDPGQAEASAGGGCCGSGGAPVEGEAAVDGDAQKIDVDTSTGSFNPNVIKLKAGVPAELTFSQAPGGCMSGVMFPDFGISEDLTAGAKTIKLPALEPGEYTFYCQMQMVSAKLVVE